MDEIDTLRSENRRLRAILDGIARAGLGKGALVELVINETEYRIGVAVCRADVDEAAFVRDVRIAIESLAEAVTGSRSLSGLRRVGVTDGDVNQDATVSAPFGDDV